MVRTGRRRFGVLMHKFGDFEGAQRELAAAAARARAQGSADRALNIEFALTRVQLASDKASDAQQRAADALAVSERVARDPAKSADVGEALLLLAQAQRQNGQTVASAATARRAAQSLAGGLGDAHSMTREARALAGP